MVQLRPTLLRDFMVCSTQYGLKYIQRVPRAATIATPALAVGGSLHAALEVWHRPGRTGTLSPEGLLARHWRTNGYASVREEQTYFALCVQVLQRYFAATPHHMGQVIGTEVFLGRIVVSGDKRVDLAGRADRITLLPNGTLEVLDYKCNLDGQVTPSAQLAQDLPTFLYYLLARMMFPQYAQVTVAQLNLFTLHKTTVDYTAAVRAENKARLLAVVDEIERQAFEPRLGPHCAWCPVRAHCPAFGPEVALDSV